MGIVGGACNLIQQTVIEVDAVQKRKELCKILLKRDPEEKALVFVKTKRNADFLASLLSQKDFSATSIHGDREQSQREEALRQFRSGQSPILIATSLAARGLDIPGVNIFF